MGWVSFDGRFGAGLVVSVLCCACGDQQAPTKPSVERVTGGLLAGPAISWVEKPSAKDSLRATYVSSRQASGDSSYHVTRELGVPSARNAVHQLSARLEAGQVNVTSTEGQFDLALRTLGVRCGDARVPVGPPETERLAGARVEWPRRAGDARIDEWWVNGPLGLQQGFVLRELPCSSDEISIDVAVDGRKPVAATNGRSVALAGLGPTRPDLTYSELFVADSNGRVLPSRLDAADGVIALRIDVRGAVFPLHVDPLLATEEAKLLPGGAAVGGANDFFGSAVALDANTAVIGGAAYMIGGAESAWVFNRVSTEWDLQGWLTASDASGIELFGQSVAIAGDTVVVGASYDAVGTEMGSAYVFNRNGSSWSETQKLVANDGGSGEQFGWSVCLSPALLAIGARSDTISGKNGQGSVYVFSKSGTTWTMQSKLTASTGLAGDAFGTSVSLSGTSLAVGAVQGDGSVANSGTAYVFTQSGTTWSEQQKLQAAAGVAGDNFGASVALDGNALFIGAPNRSVSGNAAQGGVFVFTRSGTTWSAGPMLSAQWGEAGDLFGTSLAEAGGTLAVGAESRDVNGTGTNEGSTFVFTGSGAVWTEAAELADADPGDAAGHSVAVSGNTLLVGGPRAKGVGPPVVANQGAAWVYTGSGASWSLQRRLVASAAEPGDSFAAAVAINGSTALVGAPDDDIGADQDHGSAYVFTRSGTTWSQQAVISTADVGTLRFGASAALLGDLAVLGAPSAASAQGAAYVFLRTGTTWTQQAKLAASDGAANDQFGLRVALATDLALVGAPYDDQAANVDQGAAYVFAKSGVTWSQQQKLQASDGGGSHRFGLSVAAQGTNALVGAPGSTGTAGAGYVFVRNGVSWTQQQKLTAADGTTGDQLGASAALDGTTALLGAPYGDGPVNGQGSAYVFTRTGATWTQQAELLASDGAYPHQFGSSVALSGETALVGAFFAQVGVNGEQGAGYVFVRSGTAWTQATKITASDGVAVAHFGASVSLHQGLALVNGGNPEGKGYVYRLQGVAGSSCTLATECATPYACMDGNCCSSACAGPCEVCSVGKGASAPGACTTLPAGSAPQTSKAACSVLCDGTSGACPSGCQSDNDCANDKYCNAAGACADRKVTGGTCDVSAGADCKIAGCRACQSNNCVDGYCCNSTCNGGACDTCSAAQGASSNGSCTVLADGVPPAPPGCGPYLCAGSVATCPTTCATSADCTTGNYCAGGACVPKQAKGTACTTTEQCVTGLTCADSVCCDSPCSDTCKSCKAANKQSGTDEGTCGNAKLGTNPGGACVKDSSNPCGTLAACDGAGACAKTAYGTSCGPTVCNGTAVSGKICDGTGTCVDQQNAQCAPYVCQAGACTSPCTTDVQCVSGYYCTGGFCVAKLSNGKACTAANQCDSSFCVDGVCCDAPCGGQCQACAEAGSVGQCKTVTGEPRPGKTACAGSGACKGSCAGTNPNACTFAGSATVCQAANCTGDVSQPAGTCDGSGSCTLPATANCAPYGCDSAAGSCKTSCASDTDCSQGATCNTTNNQCTTAAATCLDSTTVKLPNGQTQSCSPYKCVGGACQQQCTTTNDCASGYTCQGTACVADDGGTDGGGGGSGTGGSGTGGSGTGGSGTGGSGTGGKKSDSSGDDGGCGCRVPAREQGSGYAWLAALALGAALRRRRNA